jgi:ribosomal protein L37AE/L43A
VITDVGLVLPTKKHFYQERKSGKLLFGKELSLPDKEEMGEEEMTRAIICPECIIEILGTHTPGMSMWICPGCGKMWRIYKGDGDGEKREESGVATSRPREAIGKD